MNPQIVPIHRTESREDGMLFVRTDGIIDTMVNAPLIVAGLLVVALTIPLQTSFATTRTLDLIINSDGSTHISSQIDVDSSNFELSLFGPSIDNFVAIGSDGTTLSGEVIEDKAMIQTSDHSSITVNYDIHDLISKEGRIWTFSFDSPTNYSLLMPENSVIVGMNILPENMEQLDSQIKLDISPGSAQIDYIFSTPVETPTTPPEFSFDSVTIGLIVGPIAAAIIASVIVVKKRQSKPQLQTEIIQDIPKPTTDSLTPDTIFNLRPDMREDDKEIVKFISENGGEVFESELRKKFLQPRTTMWRAVKRLERLGVVEIYKKRSSKYGQITKRFGGRELKSLTLLALLVLTVGIISTNQAFAEPLDSVSTSVSNYDGDSATVEITWNNDDSVKNYKVGCVSCTPNIVEFTTGNSMTIDNVTPFPNGSSALLYVISYDSENNIITAKQLIVNLNQ